MSSASRQELIAQMVLGFGAAGSRGMTVALPDAVTTTLRNPVVLSESFRWHLIPAASHTKTEGICASMGRRQSEKEVRSTRRVGCKRGFKRRQLRQPSWRRWQRQPTRQRRRKPSHARIAGKRRRRAVKVMATCRHAAQRDRDRNSDSARRVNPDRSDSSFWS